MLIRQTFCTHVLSAMCLALCVGVPAQAEKQADAAPMTLPSGQIVTLMEERREQDPLALRLRYLAPDLASPMTRPSFDSLTTDLEHLCATEGLPRHANWGRPEAGIIVSLSAEALEFGIMNADVPQVFEAFVVSDGTCMLELF